MRLLEEVSRVPVEKYRAGVASSIRESLFMLEQLEKKASAAGFRNMERVTRLNNELTEEFSKFESARRRNRRFPSPPLPGTRSIVVPIRSEWELIREGKEPSNCVASYADRVINRSTYIYQVLAPERCTLSIVRGPDGSWEVDQLKLRFNGKPSLNCQRTIQRWLEGFGFSV